MTTAEEKGFTDMCSLLLSRGSVYRMMGNSYLAAVDFARSLELVDEEDSVNFFFSLIIFFSI